MDLAAFAPLVGRFGKIASIINNRDIGELSSDELKQVAVAIGGEGAQNGLLPLLVSLQSKTPTTKVLEALGSPEANEYFSKLKDKTNEVNSSIMVACPLCKGHYEASLSA